MSHYSPSATRWAASCRPFAKTDVARFDCDGGRVPTNLFEAAAWHYNIVATCRRCRRESVFHGHALWWLFHRKGWHEDFGSVAKRLKCSKCGGQARIAWHDRKPVTVVLPLPDEREWKRAVSRFRS